MPTSTSTTQEASAALTMARRAWKVGEVAERIGVSESSVYRQIAAGKIPVVRVGRLVRVRDEDLEAYLAANRSAA